MFAAEVARFSQNGFLALVVLEAIEVELLATDFPSSPYKLADGDVFLLCSDGLTTMLINEEVEEILKSNSPREACHALVDLANKKGGKDNITVQVVKIERAR